jgi:hypothetical protein
MMSVASAADLPMKAKAPAVQYVKVCTLYGAGYYYIPGSDTCLKIGGFIRIDMWSGATGAPYESVDFDGKWNRGLREFNVKARAWISFDARHQTEYGTLRAYAHLGANLDNVAGSAGSFAGGLGLTPYMDRAFIQLAGFTWGLTDSIFDAYSTTPYHLNIVAATNGSIGATGIWQWRYTAQFGGGFSASIAIEDPDRRDKPLFTGGGPAAARKGAKFPDVTANLAGTGPWGSAQVAVALHDASSSGLDGNAAIDKLGWAAMVGGLFKVPGLEGDTFGFQLTYAKGATGYVVANANTAANGIYTTVKGGTTTLGVIADGAISGGVLNLAEAWGFEVGYEHAWSRTLKTSLAGGYVDVSYPSTGAVGLCGAGLCDTTLWNIASRTAWTPVPYLSFGLDVMYTHMDTTTGGAAVAGTVKGDADIWTAMVRVQHAFFP